MEAALPPGKSREELNAAIETTISRVWSQMKGAARREVNDARSLRIHWGMFVGRLAAGQKVRKPALFSTAC